MSASRVRWATCVLCTSLIFVGLMGCCFVAAPAPPPPPPPAPPQKQANVGDPPPKQEGEGSAGRKVFETHCVKCHKIAGVEAGKMFGKGPELTTVGGKRERAWIIDHVRDPRAHNKMSKMPAYDASKISDADMQALGDYLASLK